MTRREIINRNRTNAAKSTGPRTSEGKRATSRNALRHGATARPNGEQVAAWLRIILDQPSLGLDGILFSDARIRPALALAEAEARLSAGEAALKRFEEQAREHGEILPDLLTRAMPAIAGLNASLPTGSKTRHAKTILKRILMSDDDHQTLGGWRHRLFLRYRDEARSRRRRAFQDWVTFLQLKRRA